MEFSCYDNSALIDNMKARKASFKKLPKKNFIQPDQPQSFLQSIILQISYAFLEKLEQIF